MDLGSAGMKWLTDRLAALDGVTIVKGINPDTERWLLERLAEAKLIIAHASGLYSEWLQARDWLDKIEQGPDDA